METLASEKCTDQNHAFAKYMWVDRRVPSLNVSDKIGQLITLKRCGTEDPIAINGTAFKIENDIIVTCGHNFAGLDNESPYTFVQSWFLQGKKG